jgi:glutamate carboxypeptidase
LALTAIAHSLARELERRGALVEAHDAPGLGRHLVARIGGDLRDEPPLLVLGHMDTVHPVGTLAGLPFVVDGDRVRGPGAYDMKGGLAVALAALDLLREQGMRPTQGLTFIVTCDEEIGSQSSRALLEEQGRAAAGALVLEPCVPGGGAKTRRKGVGGFQLEVRGRAAHAGIEPEAGASAIHELMRVLERVRALADPERGTTLNVGVIEGGTRANVVAERARAEVDLRFWDADEAERVERAVAAIAAEDPRCALTVAGGVNRGALARTEASARLFETAREIASTQGWRLAEGSTGGASDGNLVSAVGCPTLDGLGPDGGGAHSLDEHVRLADIAPRIALIAGLFARAGGRPPA